MNTHCYHSLATLCFCSPATKYPVLPVSDADATCFYSVCPPAINLDNAGNVTMGTSPSGER